MHRGDIFLEASGEKLVTMAKGDKGKGPVNKEAETAHGNGTILR